MYRSDANLETKFHDQSVPVDFSSQNSEQLIVSEGTTAVINLAVSAVQAGTAVKGTWYLAVKKKCVQVVGREFRDGNHKHLHIQDLRGAETITTSHEVIFSSGRLC